MVSSTPAIKVSRDFAREVKQLLDGWKPIKDGYALLAKKHIEFAEMIFALWGKAKTLDRGTGASLHKDYMRKELQELVQTDDQSILSRWRTIGEQAGTLMTVAKKLPADRDHLYELARALKQNKPVAEWVEAEKVHPGSSVREIRSLKTEGERKKPSAKTARVHSVSLNFSSDLEADAVVSILESVLLSDSIESIKTSKAIQAACESVFRDDYDRTLKAKFQGAAPVKKSPKRKQAAKK